MSLKKTIVLAILLAGAILYYYQVTVPRERANELEQLVLHGVNGDELVSIKVESPKEIFTLTNSNPKPVSDSKSSGGDSDAAKPTSMSESWRFEGAEFSALDKTSVNSVIGALSALKYKDEIPQSELGQDLSVFGLQQPEFVYSVEHPSIGKVQLKFGKVNEYVKERYMQIGASGKVYMVPDSVASSLKKSSVDLRDKNPITFADKDVAEISVKSKESTFRVGSQDGLIWDLLAPVSARASDQAVQGLLRTLRNFRVAEFIDNEPFDSAKYGLNAPILEVALTFNEASKRKPLVVRVGSINIGEGAQAKQDFYFSIGEGKTVFRLMGPNPVTALARPVEDLRERKLAAFPIEQVQRLVVTAEGAEVNLERSKDGQWSVDQKRGDRVFIEEYLKSVSGLQATQFYKEGQPINDIPKPQLEIKVSFEQLESAKNVGRPVPDGGDLVISVGDSLPSPKVGETKAKGGAVQTLRPVVVTRGDSKVGFLLNDDGYKRIIPKVEALIEVAKDKAEPTATPAADSAH